MFSQYPTPRFILAMLSRTASISGTRKVPVCNENDPGDDLSNMCEMNPFLHEEPMIWMFFLQLFPAQAARLICTPCTDILKSKVRAEISVFPGNETLTRTCLLLLPTSCAGLKPPSTLER